jgi:recombination protein RecT
MSNQVTKQQTKDLSPEQSLRNDLTRMLPQFEMVLPDNVTPEKFLRVVLTTVLSNRNFLTCSRDSLFKASLQCAADGLIPDGKEAAMIPFGKEVTYLPMVQGIYKKARNSGEIAILCADLVYPSDVFKYGTDSDRGRFLEHTPDLLKDRKISDVICVFALSKTKDGDVDFEVMTRQDIEFVRSKAKAPNSPAWSNWWGEMAKKVVVKRLAKRLPTSADVQNLIDRDNEEYDLNATQSAPVYKSKADELSAKLSGMTEFSLSGDEEAIEVESHHVEDAPQFDEKMVK